MLLLFFFLFDPREPWLTVRNRRCRGKEGCYKPPYTTPDLAPEPGRCHCHGIDICSLPLNFLPRHGSTSVSIVPHSFLPPLFSPAENALLSSSLLFTPPPEKNGRWTTRRCPESLNFFKISSRFYGYSCLEEDFWQDFLLGGREKKGGLGGKRDVTKTIPTSCSVVQSYCRNNVRPI